MSDLEKAVHAPVSIMRTGVDEAVSSAENQSKLKKALQWVKKKYENHPAVYEALGSGAVMGTIAYISTSSLTYGIRTACGMTVVYAIAKQVTKNTWLDASKPHTEEEPYYPTYGWSKKEDAWEEYIEDNF